jgi:hypothetical protein
MECVEFAVELLCETNEKEHYYLVTGIHMNAICHSSCNLTVIHQTQAKVSQAYNGYWHCGDDQHHINTHYERVSSRC